MKLEKSLFTRNLVRINALRFNKWVFEPGMLFKSQLKWWAGEGGRGEGHNGLDLRTYEGVDGSLQILDGNIRVPLIYEGRIVCCIKDFLGYTLFAAHDIYETDSRLFTIYGHVLPASDNLIGDTMKEGTVIATMSEARGNMVPAHLHISAALISDDIPVKSFSWKILGESDKVHFFDPIDII